MLEESNGKHTKKIPVSVASGKPGVHQTLVSSSTLCHCLSDPLLDPSLTLKAEERSREAIA